MGVDFHLRCVKPINNIQFENVNEENTFFYTRDHNFTDVFDTRWNQEIQKMLKKEVSFEWYDKRFSFIAEKYEEPKLSDCFDPKIILECILEVWNAIKLYNEKLPIFYYIGKKNELRSMSNSEKFFLNGLPYFAEDRVKGFIATPNKNQKDWDVSNAKEIDLSDKTEIECNECLIVQNEEGKWVYKEGKRIKLYIKKISYEQEHEYWFEEMVSVCKKAIKNSYLIFTYIS
jgi:hypothetical protein